MKVAIPLVLIWKYWRGKDRQAQPYRSIILGLYSALLHASAVYIGHYHHSLLGEALVLFGTVLQIGRSLVRSQLVSLEFLIDIKSFRSHYGPEVDTASNRNEYQQHILGGKGGRCVRLILPPSCAFVMKSGDLNFLEPSGPLQACNRTALPSPLTFRHHASYI